LAFAKSTLFPLLRGERLKNGGESIGVTPLMVPQ
jgi:hypothetical protein